MNVFTLPAAVEPEEWTVVFHTEASSRWFALIALGRFKHVSAFAYLPGLKGWVIHDWQYGGLRVAVLPHSDEACRLIRAMFGSTTEWVKVARRPGPSSTTGLRLGSCVGAVKQLLGIRSHALRPDALHRYLVRHGTEAPQYQQPADDPAYLALQQQAQQDQINATQQRVQMDSASLMARYGTRLTMAAAGGAAPAAGASPTMAAPIGGTGMPAVMSAIATGFKAA